MIDILSYLLNPGNMNALYQRIHSAWSFKVAVMPSTGKMPSTSAGLPEDDDCLFHVNLVAIAQHIK